MQPIHTSTRSHHARKAFTVLEVMLALVILSVVGLGAGIGLQAVAKVPEQTDDALAIHNEIVSRLEMMRGTPFASLPTQATLLSTTLPTVMIAGTGYPCTVTVVSAAPDTTNGTQVDFVKITVTIASQSASTYVCQ